MGPIPSQINTDECGPSNWERKCVLNEGPNKSWARRYEYNEVPRYFLSSSSFKTKTSMFKSKTKVPYLLFIFVKMKAISSPETD